jgi:pimeloyl-ACP methyl ester carboxylesterase
MLAKLDFGLKLWLLTGVALTHTNIPSSSSFWIPALQASGLGKSRDLYAYDMDGHGLSDFSGRDVTMDDYVADLEGVLAALGIKRAVIVGHSMNGVSAVAVGSWQSTVK